MPKPTDTISVPCGKGAFINASLWENEIDQDGQKFTTFSITIEKRYQKDGTWHTATAFSANELLIVAYVATTAFDRLRQMRCRQELSAD